MTSPQCWHQTLETLSPSSTEVKISYFIDVLLVNLLISLSPSLSLLQLSSILYFTTPYLLVVGVSYSKLGEHEAAILDLSTVLLLCPEHFNAAFERSVVSLLRILLESIRIGPAN